jgi:hypothetical protein
MDRIANWNRRGIMPDMYSIMTWEGAIGDMIWHSRGFPFLASWDAPADWFGLS